MRSLVFLLVNFLGETFVADGAVERLVGRVCKHVLLQIGPLCKTAVARFAFVWFLPGVD